MIIDGVLGHRLGLRVNGAVAAVTAALAFGAWRWPTRAGLLAHAAVAISIVGLVAISLLTGHTRSPVLWFLGAVPLSLGYLRSARDDRVVHRVRRRRGRRRGVAGPRPHQA